MPKLGEGRVRGISVPVCFSHSSVSYNCVPIFAFKRVSSEWQGATDLGKESTVLAKETVNQGKV